MIPTKTKNGNGNGATSVIDVDLRSLYYGDFKAVRDTRIAIKKNAVTAFIGPSGCGKSTVLRSINRMNDLIRGFRFDGQIRFRDKDIYGTSVDPVAVRRHIGMVFQQPNPFAMSIYRNVAYRTAPQRLSRQHQRQGRTSLARRRAVGRGEGQAAPKRPGALRRPATAPVHCPRDRHRTRSAVDG